MLAIFLNYLKLYGTFYSPMENSFHLNPLEYLKTKIQITLCVF